MNILQSDVVFVGDLINFTESCFIRNIMSLRLNFDVKINNKIVFGMKNIPFLTLDDPKFIGFFLLDKKGNNHTVLNNIYKVKKYDHIEIISNLKKYNTTIADAYRHHTVLNKKPIILQYKMLLKNDTNIEN